MRLPAHDLPAGRRLDHQLPQFPDNDIWIAATAWSYDLTLVGRDDHFLLNDRLGAWPGSRDREDGDSAVRARDEAIGLVELALLPTHLSLLANGVGMHVDMSRVSRGVYGGLMIALAATS